MLDYDFILSLAARISANLKNHKKSAFYFLIFFATMPAFSQDWELKKEEDGIKIYTRLPEGSKLEEVRSTVRVKTSLSAFTALLKDVPGYTAWAYNCVEAKLIEAINDTAQIYYSHTSLPWPASDRDLVMRSSLKQDPQTLIIKTNTRCVPEMAEEKEGIVRVKTGKTSWTLTPIRGGFVDVDYFVSLDPGGNIPAWMVNYTIATGPLHALQTAKMLLENGKYKDSKFWFVKEME